MHVRAAVRADIPTLASVYARAFHDDQLFSALHPRRNEFPEDFTASFARTFQTLFCTRNVLILVAADESSNNGVAGVGVWVRDGTLGGKDINPRAGLLLDVEFGLRALFARIFPPNDRSGAPEVRAEFDRAFARIGAKDELIPPARWHLKYLGVDPAFQRRGVGAILVSAGVDRAREEGVPAMLEASPNGKNLYEKLGFRVVGEMVLENTGVGGPVMRWDPPEAPVE